MLRKICFFLLFLLGILVVYYWDLLGYGWMQAKGQFNLITNVREISEILNDPSYPDSVKQKILLIQEIKKFGVDSLGLKASNNYTTYYDQQGKKLMWLLTASPPYQIEADRKSTRLNSSHVKISYAVFCLKKKKKKKQLLDFTTYALIIFFFLMLRLPPTSTLFPYTTLFRSAKDPSNPGNKKIWRGFVGTKGFQ